jgi:hypothetical protein
MKPGASSSLSNRVRSLRVSFKGTELMLCPTCSIKRSWLLSRFDIRGLSFVVSLICLSVPSAQVFLGSLKPSPRPWFWFWFCSYLKPPARPKSIHSFWSSRSENYSCPIPIRFDSCGSKVPAPFVAVRCQLYDSKVSAPLMAVRCQLHDSKVSAPFQLCSIQFLQVFNVRCKDKVEELDLM